MTQNIRAILIGEMAVSNDPTDVLVVYGLGSCVVTCLYDPVARIGGLLHSLLPTASGNHKAIGCPTKFVDQGIPCLLNELLAKGAQRRRLRTYLCGGARMVIAPGFDDSLNIGQRNVLAAQLAIKNSGLSIRDKAVGGQTGRTVKLYIATGQVTVRSLGEKEKPLV